MRFTHVITTLLLLLTTAPLVRAESSADPYADSTYNSHVRTYAPDNAAGAPDSVYTDFLEQWATVSLDMGEGEEGDGDLTLSYRISEYGASYQVDFLDADRSILQTSSGSFAMYSSEMTIPYEGDPYRYVVITCTQDHLWSLDAVSSAGIAEPSTEPSEEQADGSDGGVVAEEPSEEEPEDTARGMLVRLVDDGNPETTVDEAVYVIGADGMRHAFPSETVFKTWYQNFDDIAYIDPANLATYALGGNVTVRPGTWLVKITTDPKVYAVEPGGILRWVSTEALAESLYGNDWAKRVVDVPDTFWGNYTVGDPIVMDSTPAGSVGAISTGEVTYLGETQYFSIPGDTGTYMRFVSDFILSVTDAQRSGRAYGGDLPSDPSISFPF